MSPNTFTVRKFRYFNALWVAVLAAIVRMAAAATNLMVNSEFIAGTDGWGTVGTVFTTGENAILSDQGGTRVVIFQTVAVPVAGTAGLTLSFDFLNALSPQVELGQTPDSIFGTVYTGVVPFGSLYDSGDYDVATGLVDADHRGSVNFPAGMTLSASPKGAGWVRHTVPVPVVPFVTVAFEFIDGNDTEGDSSAAFDNIFLMAEPIPEPSVAGLVFAGGVVGLVRRRRPRRREWRLHGAVGGGSLLAGLMTLALGGELWAQDPVPPLLEPSLAKASAKAERSTLDRTTAVLTSTVELEIVNTGTQRIDGPVHALIRFRDTATGAEVRSGVTIVGALGGIGRPPHQVPYFDLTPQAAGGWMPAESIGFTLVFSRARTLNVTYDVSLAGFVNAPPTLDPGGPYTGRVGEAVSFAATASDPDGDAVTVTWEFGDGVTATGTEASHSFAAAGIKAIHVTADDGRSGVVEREVTAIISPSGNFALAHTRVVTGIGHPLGTAIVQETGPDGARDLIVANSGFTSLGTTAGEYLWKFSASGHQPVWRAATLVDGAVRLIPSPWLAADGPATDVSVLESTVMDTGSGPGSVRLTFPAGAFSQPGPARLTPLGPQSLPFPLPSGWSPLTAFHLAVPETPSTPGDADLTLLDALGPGEFLTLVRFEPDTQVWRTIKAATAPDPAQPTRIHFPITEAGAYAAVVRDEGTDAPIPVTDGNPLPAGTSQELSTRVAAVGIVDPPQRAASLDPAAVTAQAQAVFTPATGVLPSGSWFRIGVQETYDLTDGAALRTPDYDATVYAYRRPASTVAPAESVGSSRSLGAPAPKLTAATTGEGRPVAIFPLRPQFLFGPSDLTEARLHIEVLPPFGDGSAALSADGGALESGDLRLTVPANAVQGFAAGSLRALDPAAFATLAGPGQTIVRAFELNLTGLVDGSQLALTLGTPLPPNTAFALARLTRFANGSGLTPVQRLTTNPSGQLENAEPPTPPRLPGLTGAGQYLLVQLPAPQGLVTGTVVHPDTSPAPGIGVRLATQPWLDTTNTTGRFALLAPAGPGSALATHPTNGDGATASLDMPASLPPQNITLTLGALPPRLVTSSPPDGATKVSPVTPITLEFSEKLAPSSVGANPITLRAEGATEDLPGSATLDLSGRFLTFLPTAPLAAGLTHSLTLSADLRDLQGLALDGPRTLSFTTSPPAARGLGAQLTLYEPGATGPTPADQALLNAIPGYSQGDDSSHVAAIGSPGTADPEVPVILVNESTGATATVLSKPDGSFANFIDAEESDFISATFINANGTRVTIPASKQKFDDGRVGLFNGGGLVDAESLEVPGQKITVDIEPNAIPGRMVFRMESLPAAEVAAITRNTRPENARVLAGIRFEAEGDTPVNGAKSRISLPLDPAVLNLPPGVAPEDGAFTLAIPGEVDGMVTYRIVDKLKYDNGRVTTNSFIGLLASAAVDTVSFGIIQGGFAALGDTYVLLFHGTKPAVVRGRVGVERSFNLEDADNVLLELADVIGVDNLFYNDPQLAGSDPLPGAFVTAYPAGPKPGNAGRIRPGMAFYTSERDGLYNLVLPFSIEGAVTNVSGWVIEAIHPRHSRPKTEDFNFNTLFGEVAPRINIIFPAETTLSFGTGAGVGLTLDVSLEPPAVALNAPLKLKARAAAAGTTPVIEVEVLDNIAFDNPSEGQASDFTHSPGAPVRGASPSETLRTDEFRGSKALTALVRVTATADQGNGLLAARKDVLVRVGAAPPPPPDPRDPTDPHDSVGPAVAWSSPGPNEVLPAGQEIVIGFTEPVNRNSLRLGDGGVTSFPAPPGGLSTYELAPDGKTLRVQVPALAPGTTEFTVMLNSAITDLASPPNPFDQIAGTAETDIYSLTVRMPPEVSRPLPGVVQGGGAVTHGGYAYVLDRGVPPGLVRVFDLATLSTGAPQEKAAIPLPAFPRDLAFIPDWSFRRSQTSPVETKDLLLVVCGFAGVDENGQASPQLLRVYDVSNPQEPAFLQGATLSQRNGIINRVLWRPPHFSYVESGSDFQFVGVVNLQKLLIGFNATASEAASFPEQGFAGFDSNQDGDYVDTPPDVLPRPQREPIEFYGKDFTLDCSVHPKFGVIQDMDFQRGTAVAVMAGTESLFRVILSNNVPLSPTQGVIPFPAGSRARRVTLLPNTLVQLNGEGAPVPRNLALVSLAPDSDGKNKLLVVDISNPLIPEVINRIELPASLGSPGGIVQRADGQLVLMMETDALLLDTVSLDSFNPVLGVIPGAGTGGRTFSAEASGLFATALGGASEIALGPPQLQFVLFPLEPNPVQPNLLSLDEAAARDVLTRARVTKTVAPARFRAAADQESTLNPPKATSHYHVLVRAPGAAGRTLRIALEALGRSGVPQRNKGKNKAPVRTMSAAGVRAIKDEQRPGLDAPISELVAHQLSSDQTSPLYNVYLSEPFALVEESVKPSELTQLQNTASRKILTSGTSIRASIDPAEASNLVVGPFAGRVDPASLRIVPGTYTIAATVTANEVANPPPVGGDFALPNTAGAIMALNGEFRGTTVDLELPSRRMPIVFSRTCAHTTSSDDFGDGWDHFYNQRLIERKREIVPQGYKKPLILRDIPSRHKISLSGDVEFIDGAGRTILFCPQNGVPSEVANDLLLSQEAGATPDDIYYLPPESEPGVFDVLIQHVSSGEFSRVTPDGMIFRYDDDGRLRRIYDKYPANYQVLDYDEATGLLRRITDMSAPERFLEIFRYRNPGQSLNGLDQRTDNPRIAGRVCAIQDYAGRVVNYEYDAVGRLAKRISFETKSGKSGFTGRAQSVYLTLPAGGPDVVGIIEGTGSTTGDKNSGTALVSTSTVEGSSNGGHPVANRVVEGAGGPVQVEVDADNSAATNGEAEHSGTTGDGAATVVKFDALGYPFKVTMLGQSTGSDSPSEERAEITLPYDSRGRPKSYTLPEGNSVAFEFAENAENFRSRGNLKKITRLPGERGGPTVVTEFLDYDPMYNIPRTIKDPNGRIITMTLRPDLRDVATTDHDGDGIQTLDRNDFGQVTKETTPDGIVASMFYNDDGFLEESHHGTIITKYSYADDANSLANVLGAPTLITPPHGATISMSYDNRLLPVRVARGGQVTETSYDENGNPVLIERTVEEGVLYTEKRRYNQVNFLEESTVVGMKLDDTGAAADLITTYTPDALFRPKAITYPGGERRELTYDHRGNVVKDKIGDIERTFTFDQNGNILRSFAGGLRVQDYEYDGHDRLKVSRGYNKDALPTDRVSHSYYAGGELHRSTTTTSGGGGTQQDIEITRIDALGRPKELVHHGTGVSGTYSYNYTAAESGGLTTVVAGPNDTVTTVTDSAGRLVSRTDAVGTVTTDYVLNNSNPTKITSLEDDEPYFLEIGYNPLDHQVSRKDGLGDIWRDGQPRLDGLLKSRTNGRGAVVDLTYSQSGELLKESRPLNLSTRYAYDLNSQPTSVSDSSGSGHSMTYDEQTLRLTTQTLRNGGVMQFQAPDVRNNPRVIRLPGGGGITNITYDPQSRQLQSIAEHNGTTYRTENSRYDALGRLVFVNYGSGAQAGNSMELTYDALGPLRKAHYNEGGLLFDVASTLRGDGIRTAVAYADGTQVLEGRDNAGRLNSLSAGGDPICRSISYVGRAQPEVITHGGGFSETNFYDARRRLTARRYTRDTDGAVLADMRFQYDAADNLTLRQFVHRSGRADVFTYDAADRVTTAGYGLRPVVPGAEDQSFNGFPDSGSGLKPGFYKVDFTYDAGGLDRLEASTTSNPRGFPLSPTRGPDVAPFAASFADYDLFLFARNTDGFDRGDPDSLGNAQNAVIFTRDAGGAGPQRRTATSIKHNAPGHLVELTRDDGVTIRYQYQPTGLLHRRTMTNGGSTVSDTAFVWDQGRLIEERDAVGGSSTVRARYYYADADAPVAADIKDAGGTMKRFYFLKSHDSSVVAVADASGSVVERAHYSAHGMPVIEKADAAPPRLAKVEVETATTLLVHFSEPVLPRLNSAAAPALVTGTADPGQAFTLDGQAVSATWLEAAPNRPFGAAMRLTMNAPTSTAALELLPAALFDEWRNPNAGQIVTVPASTAPGTVIFPPAGTTIADTSAERSARSTVGNPFLFHGQFFDYDSGLLYLRARWYDPFTGTFLERDPMGYEDSVNLYAGMGNNPVSYRDPTGASKAAIFKRLAAAATKVIQTKSGYDFALVDEVMEAGRLFVIVRTSRGWLPMYVTSATNRGKGITSVVGMDAVGRELVHPTFNPFYGFDKLKIPNWLNKGFAESEELMRKEIREIREALADHFDLDQVFLPLGRNKIENAELYTVRETMIRHHFENRGSVAQVSQISVNEVLVELGVRKTAKQINFKAHMKKYHSAILNSFRHNKDFNENYQDYAAQAWYLLKSGFIHDH